MTEKEKVKVSEKEIAEARTQYLELKRTYEARQAIADEVKLYVFEAIKRYEDALNAAKEVGYQLQYAEADYFDLVPHYHGIPA